MITLMAHFFCNSWSSSHVVDKLIHVRGAPFYNDKIALPEMFLDQDVALLQGFFSFVIEGGGVIKAGVDRIRSMPLFYALQENKLWLSDSADWIKEQLLCENMDPVAKDEFLLAGYVTGEDTLYSSIKQIQAGETITFKFDGNVVRSEKYRYFQFVHREPLEYNVESLEQKLQNVVDKVIDRLIAYANGRQIVIPLSGGYDSRLIAAILKRKNYENVLCFTYGKPYNKEANFSRAVAESLEFKWLFIEYNESLWKESWCGEDARKYQSYAANCTSLPHIQDWLAVKILKNQNLIDEDCLFVPGHSGDFVAGSHIPDWVYRDKKNTKGDLMESIFEDHYSNVPISYTQNVDKSALYHRINDRIKIDVDSSKVSLANAYEFWDWQERQAKYIANSVRVYEFYNYDWWMPLWDKDFVEFWMDVPLPLRRGRDWFKQWIQKIYLASVSEGFKGKSPEGNGGDRGLLLGTVKKICKRLFSEEFYRKTRNLIIKDLNKDPLFFYALIDNQKYHHYVKCQYNVIGAYSDLYLKQLWITSLVKD